MAADLHDELLETITVFPESPVLKLMRVRNPYSLVEQMTEDDFGVDERMPYWADVWPSAVALARWIREGHVAMQGEWMELGAGLGLASLAAAQRGAKVTATDYFAEAVAFTQRNAALNGVTLDAQWLDWRMIDDHEMFDGVMGADVLYESRNVIPVAQAVAQLLKPGGRAVITDPCRGCADAFVTAAQAAGLDVDVFYAAVSPADREVVLPTVSPERIRFFMLLKQ